MIDVYLGLLDQYTSPAYYFVLLHCYAYYVVSLQRFTEGVSPDVRDKI
jgi:hypothetical protein